MRNKRETGALGEDAAACYLEKRGYEIVVRNYRYKNWGEIDIVARKDEYTVFVEVKTRESEVFGVPSLAVDYKKQRQIRKIAEQYIEYYKIETAVRFDVVEVIAGFRENVFTYSRINLIENAF